MGGLRDGMRLTLDPAQSDIVTISPCTTVGWALSYYIALLVQPDCDLLPCRP